jgi:AcrR family transcriptional regulator
MRTQTRAINATQKKARRDIILAVAWEHFINGSFTSATVASVAQAAGLAKGTIYLYFETKDDLFLAVMEEQLCAWMDDLNERLDALDGAAGPTAISSLMLETLTARPGLLRLLANLHLAIAGHATPDSAVPLQRVLIGRMQVTAGHFARLLPLEDASQGLLAVLRCHGLIIGMQQIGMPPGLIPPHLTLSAVAEVRANLIGELSAAIEALLQGMTSLER